MEVALLYFNHNCNSYLLINGHQCLVVDPGFNDNNCLINAINKRGLVLKGILLTHGHYDHIDGLRSIKNVPVYLFRTEEKALENSRDNCSFMSLHPFSVTDVKVIPFDDEEILDLIGIKIKVIHTPFHTAGSVCFYLKDKHIVLTGDTLFLHAIGRYDLPTSRPRLIHSSLTKLFTLPHSKENNTIVYPGHGAKTTLADEYSFLKNEYL